MDVDWDIVILGVNKLSDQALRADVTMAQTFNIVVFVNL
jgi:hypothetical protein